MSKSYTLDLPVFKKGDDLHHQIEEHKGDLKAALLVQSALYTEAARLCMKLAEAASKHMGMEIQADTHMIFVEGPKDVLDALVKEEILTVEDFDDEEEDEEGEGDDGEGDEESPEGE